MGPFGEEVGEMYGDVHNKWLSPCKVGGEALRNLCLNMTLNVEFEKEIVVLKQCALNVDCCVVCGLLNCFN